MRPPGASGSRAPGSTGCSRRCPTASPSSRWPSSAVSRSSKPTAGRCRCRRASARRLPRGRGSPRPARSTRRSPTVSSSGAEQCRSQRVGVRSNAYLPPELQAYGGALDQSGSWDRSEDYGWVWYPRVDSEWRPYYDGGWYPYGWGWTWVGGGRWVWPTHHYGRWGHGPRGWYLGPGRGLGACLGVVGGLGRLRELVPAGMERHPGVRLLVRRVVRVAREPLAWLDRGPRTGPLRADTATACSLTRFEVSTSARWNGRRSTSDATARRSPARRCGPPRPHLARPRRSGPGQRAAARRYSRAEAVARERTTGGQGIERPAAAARANAARTFSSPSRPLPSYPEGRGSAGEATTRPSLGSAVPRSAPQRPSESRCLTITSGRPSRARRRAARHVRTCVSPASRTAGRSGRTIRLP